MNFDKIIMNPPYKSGLHLVILNKGCKLAKNVVSLQPIFHFQMNKLFKKTFNDELDELNNLKVVERISPADSIKLFGTGQRQDLGIITNINGNEECEIVDNYALLSKIYENLNVIIKNEGSLKSKFEDLPKGFPIRFRYNVSNIEGGKESWLILSRNKNIAFTSEIKGHTKFLNVKNNEEQEHIFKIYNSTLMRFIIKEFGFGHLPYEVIPFLNMSWTEEKLYSFLKITEAEQKLIEKTMEKYR